MTGRTGDGFESPRPRILVAAVDPALEPRAAWLAAGIAQAWPGGLAVEPPEVRRLDLETDLAASPSAWVVIGDPEDRCDDRAAAISESLADSIAAGSPIVRLATTPQAGILSASTEPGTIAAVLAAMLEQSARLRRSMRRERAARETVRRSDLELAEAAALQREFLPKRLPRSERFECSVLWRPSWHVSGDIYDVVPVDDHHVGVFLADAVGHGVAAAILAMGLARRLEVRDHRGGPLSPAEVLRRLNASLTDLRSDLVWFATAVYALYDLRTAQVRLASAGHPSALRIAADGRATAYEASGGLLGIFEAERYSEHEFQLAEGDRLILHSDGIEPLLGGDPDRDDGSYLEHFAALAMGRDSNEVYADLIERLERPELAHLATDDVTVISMGWGSPKLSTDATEVLDARHAA